MPNALMSISTEIPTNPPPAKQVDWRDAAEIAGERGYAAGAPVQVYVEGAWFLGKIKRISTTMCPGAAQVHFVDGGLERALLVCPWQFQKLLRPAPVLQSAAPGFPTMVFDDPEQPLLGEAPIAESTPL